MMKIFAGRRSGLRLRVATLLLATSCLAGALAGSRAVQAAREPEAAAPGAESATAEATRDTWYAATISSSRSGALVTHYWSKGSRMRAETVIAGHRVVTIINGAHYYSLDPVTGEGIRVERSAKARQDDDPKRRPFATDWADMQTEGAEKVRSETLGGLEVDVFQLTDGRGRRRIWVTREEPRLQYRVETFDRRTQNSLTTDFSSWSAGIEISDSFFEPAANLEIDELSYDDYRQRAREGRVGPAPNLFPEMLHGRRELDPAVRMSR